MSEHRNDHTLSAPKGIGTFSVKQSADSAFYQYLRIRMVGENSFSEDKKHRKRGMSEAKTWSILSLKGVLENTEGNRFVLCCSGIEFFGNIIIGDNYSHHLRRQRQRVRGGLMDQSEVRRFEYKSDFDENGILYHIGTDFGTSKWTNPSRSLAVKIERGKQSEKGSVDHVVERNKVSGQLWTT